MRDYLEGGEEGVAVTAIGAARRPRGVFGI